MASSEGNNASTRSSRAVTSLGVPSVDTTEKKLSAVLDVLADYACASLVGIVDNLAGRVPLDPFLAPRAWR